MLMKREQDGKAFCSRLSAPLRCYRTRTAGGYVARSCSPKFRFTGKLHISPERYMKLPIGVRIRDGDSNFVPLILFRDCPTIQKWKKKKGK